MAIWDGLQWFVSITGLILLYRYHIDLCLWYALRVSKGTLNPEKTNKQRCERPKFVFKNIPRGSKNFLSKFWFKDYKNLLFSLKLSVTSGMQSFEASCTNILQFFSANIAEKPSRNQFKRKFKSLARLVMILYYKHFVVFVVKNNFKLQFLLENVRK